MSNRVNSRITISGTVDKLLEFFNFGRAQRGEVPFVNVEAAFKFINETETLAEKFKLRDFLPDLQQRKDLCDINREELGTKTNAYFGYADSEHCESEIDIENDEDGRRVVTITVNVETAWRPCDKWVENVQRKFPELEFSGSVYWYEGDVSDEMLKEIYWEEDDENVRRDRWDGCVDWSFEEFVRLEEEGML